jgi:hypothetical protein
LACAFLGLERDAGSSGLPRCQAERPPRSVFVTSLLPLCLIVCSRDGLLCAGIDFHNSGIDFLNSMSYHLFAW